MRRRQLIKSTSMAALALIAQRARFVAANDVGLKDHFKDDFLVGTMLSNEILTEPDAKHQAIVTKDFNAITAENCMKWEGIQPSKGDFTWELADKFIEYGVANQINIVGHVLVWHSQTPDYVFNNWLGKPRSAKSLGEMMQKHIHALAGRYAGKIWAWDVVNEAVTDDGKWRESPWFKILGEDFIRLAFNTAREVDDKALLVYNDYNMHLPKKRDFIAAFTRYFKTSGMPIDAIGMQGHVGLDFPDFKELERSIIAYGKTGLKVHFTELDIDVLPAAWDYIGAEISTEFEYSDKLNPYVDGLPKDIEQKLTDRYREFFTLCLKHRDIIERVSLWGVHDGENWKNGFPVKGRTNYPLLFDRKLEPKPAYYELFKL